MKKLLLSIILFISLFSFSISFVGAKSINNINVLKETGPNLDPNTSYDEADICGAFGDPRVSTTFGGYLQQIFNVMKFAGILLAIIMTIKDLIKAVAEQKPETFSKLGHTTLKRVIYAALIFVLPTILNFIFDIIGLYGTCGIL